MISREEYQANGSDAEQAQRIRVKHGAVRKEAIPIQMQWSVHNDNQSPTIQLQIYS